nr:hypothetical protein [Tanacetum cinerariifolium]
MHQTCEKSSLAMTHKLDGTIEFPESQPKKTYKEDLECEMVMVKIPRCMSWLGSTDAYDEPIGSLGSKPPIKPHSPDSFRMKVIDPLTIHTPPSPHMASFHLKDVYYYYHPCIDDPKKHYGFKPGLLGKIGYLGVDFLNLEMIEDD